MYHLNELQGKPLAEFDWLRNADPAEYMGKGGAVRTPAPEAWMVMALLHLDETSPCSFSASFALLCTRPPPSRDVNGRF